MKQIINDLIFDTETSEVVYESEKRKIYYKSPNDRFFLVLPTGEFRIIEEEAMKQILGVHDIDKYIELFGEPSEG